MRKIALAATGVLLSVGLLSPIQAFAIDDVNTKKLRKAVTVSGILQHERALQTHRQQQRRHPCLRHTRLRRFGRLRRQEAAQGRLQGAEAEFTFPFFQRPGACRTRRSSRPTPGTIETGTFDYSGSGDVTGPCRPDQ